MNGSSLRFLILSGIVVCYVFTLGVDCGGNAMNSAQINRVPTNYVIFPKLRFGNAAIALEGCLKVLCVPNSRFVLNSGNLYDKDPIRLLCNSSVRGKD